MWTGVGDIHERAHRDVIRAENVLWRRCLWYRSLSAPWVWIRFCGATPATLGDANGHGGGQCAGADRQREDASGRQSARAALDNDANGMSFLIFRMPVTFVRAA